MAYDAGFWAGKLDVALLRVDWEEGLVSFLRWMDIWTDFGGGLVCSEKALVCFGYWMGGMAAWGCGVCLSVFG